MRFKKIFPFLRWFPLKKEDMRADMIAGATVGFLLVPQSMAYAQLAGLPPYYGLYTAFIPVIVSALFGWCSQLHTGPVAMTSLLTATVILETGLAKTESAEYISLAIAISFIAGLIQLSLGLFKLSSVVNFLSRPVIVGFTNAGAIIIAMSQVNLFMRVPMGTSNSYVLDLCGVFRQAGNTHLPTLVFGSLAIAAIFLIKRMRPKWPGILIVVIASTIISYLSGYEDNFGGDVVGAIPPGLPALKLPVFKLDQITKLFAGSFMIAMIGFLEVLAVSKVISAKTHERLDLDQELVGQGMAKIVGGISQCYPVSGSFSRSALNLYAGAKTGMSSVFAAALVMIVLLFLTPFLYYLPKAVLGAVIVVAVIGLVDFRAFIRIWKISRYDGTAAIVTFCASIAIAPRVTEGILIGALLTIIFHLYQVMKPDFHILGMDCDGLLKNADRYDLDIEGPVLAVGFRGRLVFANASHFEESILQAISSRAGVKALLIVSNGINDLDATGEETLRNIVCELTGNGIEVVFAEVPDRVADVMKQTGLHDLVGNGKFVSSAETVFDDLKRKYA